MLLICLDFGSGRDQQPDRRPLLRVSVRAACYGPHFRRLAEEPDAEAFDMPRNRLMQNLSD